MRPRGRGRPWVIRRVSGLLGALTAAGILLVAVAPAASAHATLLFTSPAADSATSAAPKAITLTFNQSVTLEGTPVTLAGAGDRKIALGPARESGGRRAGTPPGARPLPRGGDTVAWPGVSPHRGPVGSPLPFPGGPRPPAPGRPPARAP